MRRYLSRSIAILGLLLATATVSSASTIALDVTSDTQIFAPGVFHNIGWQFTVNAPITVDGLGLFDVNPAALSENHQIGLWDNGGNLLAQTTVTFVPAVAAAPGQPAAAPELLIQGDPTLAPPLHRVPIADVDPVDGSVIGGFHHRPQTGLFPTAHWLRKWGSWSKRAWYPWIPDTRGPPASCSRSSMEP